MKTTRRRFLKYTGVAILSGASATIASYYLMSPASGPKPGSTTNTTTRTTIGIDVSYRPPEYLEFMEWLKSVSGPCAGKKIVVAMENEPFSRAIQRIDPDFYNHTGISVGYELTPFLQNLTNTTLAVTTRSPTYDVMNVDGSMLARFREHLIPPQELAERYPDLTYDELDLDDFLRVGWAFSAKYPQDLIFPPYEKDLGGAVIQWPQDIPLMLHFYRKDLYDAEGLKPARTWDEYYEDIKHFDKPGEAIFGAVSMAFPHPSVVFEYLNHLYSFGGQIWELDDGGLRCVIDSDEAVAALENFERMRRYSDPGSGAYTWSEAALALAYGRAVNAIQWQDYASMMDHPNKSVVVDKFGYSVNPAGPAGSFSTFGGAGIGVSRYSRNPEVAWLWLQWATASGTQIVTLQDPLNNATPTRKSVFEDPMVKKDIENGRLRYLPTAREIISSNRLTALISFPGWERVRVILSENISAAYRASKAPREALKDAKEEIDKLGPVFTF